MKKLSENILQSLDGLKCRADGDSDMPTPSICDAAEFIRDRYGIHIYTTFLLCDRSWSVHVEDMYGYYYTPNHLSRAKSHDAALELGIERAIEIINEDIKTKSKNEKD